MEPLNAQVRIIRAGAVAHVLCAGEFDVAEAAHLDDVLDALVTDDPPDVAVFNLRGIEFMGSSGLTALVRFRRRFAHVGGSMLITDCSSLADRVIRMCGLAEHLSLDNDLTRIASATAQRSN